MVLAILEKKGDSNYLSKRGGISFGIRKCFMTIPDGNDVIMSTESQRESEFIQEEIINHMRNIKVWYNSPKTTILTKENLGKQQNDLLSA